MLYTLARLTEPRATLQASLFWPEGVDDLAIFDDRGVLREAIQIKAHTAPLTLSELVSRRGNGLMQRAVEIARKHPECRVCLLSFGPFGQELQDAWEGARAHCRSILTKHLSSVLGLANADSADGAVLQGYLDRHRTIARSMVAAIAAQDPSKGARHFVIADHAEHQAAVARSKVDSPASGSAVMPGAIG